MTKHDKSPLVTLSDVAASLGLLSRLPVRVDSAVAAQRGAQAAWAYPIAGLILALLAASVAQLALWLALPAGLSAGLCLVTLITTTGAMHEDGLADTADGFWGGWDKARRLAIMKDSHIGTYGVLALILSLGLRWLALTHLIDAGHLWAGLIATAMISRAVMLPVMARLPHARDTGLSHAVGRPSLTTSRIGETVAVAAALVLWQVSGLWLIATALLAVLACAAIAKSKINGQTGDVLGATQQITEITLLLTLAALL